MLAHTLLSLLVSVLLVMLFFKGICPCCQCEACVPFTTALSVGAFEILRHYFELINGNQEARNLQVYAPSPRTTCAEYGAWQYVVYQYFDGQYRTTPWRSISYNIHDRCCLVALRDCLTERRIPSFFYSRSGFPASSVWSAQEGGVGSTSHHTTRPRVRHRVVQQKYKAACFRDK